MKLYQLFVLFGLFCTAQGLSSDSLGSPLAQNPRRGLTWQERLQYYLCCCCKKQDRPEEDDDLDIRYGIHADARRGSQKLQQQIKKKHEELGFWI